MKRYPVFATANIVLAMLSLLSPMAVLTSDHIDGPVTRRDGSAAITDLYAFPAAEPGWLAVIVNLYPLLPGNGHFSDQVRYEFLLGPATITGTGITTGFSVGDEVRIVCRFSGPDGQDPDTARCTGGEIDVSGRLGEPVDDRGAIGARLFAGRRADPFFFASDWVTRASKEGILLEPEDDNILADANVLSIVLEVELEKLGLGGIRRLESPRPQEGRVLENSPDLVDGTPSRPVSRSSSRQRARNSSTRSSMGALSREAKAISVDEHDHFEVLSAALRLLFVRRQQANIRKTLGKSREEHQACNPPHQAMATHMYPWIRTRSSVALNCSEKCAI